MKTQHEAIKCSISVSITQKQASDRTEQRNSRTRGLIILIQWFSTVTQFMHM